MASGDGDRPEALTLAVLADVSSLVVAGEVTRVRRPSSRDPETSNVEIAVRDYLEGDGPATVRAISLDPLDVVTKGASGIFFLAEGAGARGRPVLPGDDGALLSTTPGFDELRAYVEKILAGRQKPVALALDALTSRHARLRLEGAFDLERLQLRGVAVPAAAARPVLAALRDRTFPEEARATLARAAAGVPGVGDGLARALVELLDAGVGDAGFQAEAAELLAGRRGSRTIAVLRKLVDSDNQIVRAQALTSLGAIGTGETLDVLRAVAQTHPDPVTRDVAQQVLRQA